MVTARTLIAVMFTAFVAFSGSIFDLPVLRITPAELSPTGQLVFYFGMSTLVGVVAILASLICVKDN